MSKVGFASMSGRVFEFNSGAKYPDELLEASDLESLGALMTSDFGVWRPSDVGLCFGNPEYYKSIAETAASLYHRGMFPVVVASGSVSVSDGDMPEAHAMREVLLGCGVPDSAIFVEDYSTNSKENILCS
ncbi:MAG: ElyC/SanA/YdcF family protein, partial [Bdellovibrionales bacterium]